jgi:predicted DsbA family dithiol-disulfide isomerase
MALLDNEKKRKEVIAKEQFWQSRGVSAVPTFVFNNTSGVSGAQPVSVFKQVLSELIDK